MIKTFNMKQNQHSDSIVTLWYLSEIKIRKLEGVPYRSNSRFFDFEIIRDKNNIFYGKNRIVRLDRANVLFCCPMNINHISKQQFRTFFDILKIGRIKDAFPSRTICMFEEHIYELPEPLKSFVTGCFNGMKKPSPGLDSGFLDILKGWCEYVFSKIPHD